jgi:hypothetical protein
MPNIITLDCKCLIHQDVKVYTPFPKQQDNALLLLLYDLSKENLYVSYKWF